MPVTKNETSANYKNTTKHLEKCTSEHGVRKGNFKSEMTFNICFSITYSIT